MKLLDTSVWIPFLRRKGDPGAKRYVANVIAADEAAYTCPVSFELVGGALDQELPGVMEALTFADRLPLEEADWDAAGEASRELRKAGVNVPHDDLLIATVASNRQIPLVCRDKHFAMIRSAVYRDLMVEEI
ncbi:MAG: PIN domain-containing protein [Verrucomicrobiota bacterium]